MYTHAMLHVTKLIVLEVGPFIVTTKQICAVSIYTQHDWSDTELVLLYQRGPEPLCVINECACITEVMNTHVYCI